MKVFTINTIFKQLKISLKKDRISTQLSLCIKILKPLRKNQKGFIYKGRKNVLTLIRAAIKKSNEWRLQVQIASLAEVDMAPSRPE